MVPGEEACRRKPRPGGRFVREADCQKEPSHQRRYGTELVQAKEAGVV
jgi:hypothetical protein